MELLRNNICRTCMSEATEHGMLHFIYDTATDEEAATIADLLVGTIPRIHVNLDDELPKNICPQCLDILLKIAVFQKMCLSSQNKMLAYLVSASNSTLGARTKRMQDASGLKFDITTNVDALQANEFFIKEELLSEQDTSFDAYIEENNEREYIMQQGNEECSKDEIYDYEESHLPTEENSFGQQKFDATGELTVLNFEDDAEEFTAAHSSYISIHSDIQIIEDEPETLSAKTKYDCCYCGKVFIRKQCWIKHEQRHQNEQCPKILELKRYECPSCSKLFLSRRNLRNHKKKCVQFTSTEGDATLSSSENLFEEDQQAHSSEKPYKCHNCYRRFNDPSNLQRHLRTHTGEKFYRCKFCAQTFMHNGQLIYHMRKSFGQNIYSCKLCPRRFPFRRDVRKHLSSHENEDMETRLKNLSALKKEKALMMKTHRKDRPKQTPTKQKQTPTRKKQNPTKKKPFQCKYCDKCFYNTWLVKRHQLTHFRCTKNSQEGHDKRLTQPKFLTAADQSFHNKNATEVHGKEQYECSACSVIFDDYMKLYYHKRLHAAEPKQFDCKECNTTFASFRFLKQHQNVHGHTSTTSTTKEIYKCNYCDKSYSYQISLTQHQRIHTGEKNHKCKFCLKTFAYNTQLISHLRTLLGENVYGCKQCPRRFPLARNVREHLESHKNEDEVTRLKNINALHEEEAKLTQQHEIDAKKKKHCKEKPFECNYCDKSFYNSWLLKRHSLTHFKGRHNNQGRQFKCNYCEKAYTQKGNLTIHVRKHHEVDV